MVLVEKWPFLQLFFLGNIGQKNKFYDILEQTRSSKSQKIEIFPKGVTHGFGPKIALFPTFFFGIVGHENMFCDILERKSVFLGYKNKKLKNLKN